jgi:uncharacterized delta-60 repeat protein
MAPLDSSFETDPMEVGGSVYKMLIQPDGKIIFIGAQRIEWPANNVGVIRLNADGTLDSSFDMGGAGFNNSVTSGILQSDGKIIVSGSFTQFNSTAINRIARLNSDGTLDTSFDPGTGFDFDPQVVELQADGKILVGGLFEEFDGVERNHIARLNADGSLDNSFNPGNQFTDQIRTIAVQTDGKIIVGGNLIDNFPFGVIRPRIKRLNSDGSVDATFATGNGFDAVPNSFFIQPDGKIIAGGDFTNYDGTEIRGIARLNTNGTLDSSFDPGNGFQSSANPGISFVEAIAIQSDGKILSVGNFQTYNGTPRNKIARLIGDGATVSLNNFDEVPEINVFPNPAAVLISINNLPEHAMIRVIDGYGKVILSRNTIEKSEFFDVSNLSNGNYLIQITTLENKQVSRNFIVHK